VWDRVMTKGGGGCTRHESRGVASALVPTPWLGGVPRTGRKKKLSMCATRGGWRDSGQAKYVQHAANASAQPRPALDVKQGGPCSPFEPSCPAVLCCAMRCSVHWCSRCCSDGQGQGGVANNLRRPHGGIWRMQGYRKSTSTGSAPRGGSI
jgi:hypothetical protein